jgi:hypothetical protein
MMASAIRYRIDEAEGQPVTVISSPAAPLRQGGDGRPRQRYRLTHGVRMPSLARGRVKPVLVEKLPDASLPFSDTGRSASGRASYFGANPCQQC